MERTNPERPVELWTERLLVFLPIPGDAPRLARFYDENRAHLGPWDPLRPEEFYREDWWRGRLAEAVEAYELGLGVHLAFASREDPQGPVLGVANFSNVVRGAFHSCYLGYGVDGRHEGQGLMREALEASIAFVFERLRLHRIMANYQPTNVRSGALLRRLGFVVEGYARDYLRLGGAWRDHVLTALTNPSWRAGGPDT